ncbi:molybdopterin cofactor-binding domain-containing protein [Novosphingobium piscinae]|uniref:Xanthine dehydrogenase family protein molybdopterin-binding subunit n=1 Tax=Novosphingobium piscinae TaxID=1507448 RepID=A0A7X1G0G7_9SPHN|nr:molybdopterin cofactor-binding domain-containing protein [Novosphingobium piscinae]MBC2670400.1 xanthine dehydrogenase family protein molybdopterin-binding subunit [Novosphingobium piscinae]
MAEPGLVRRRRGLASLARPRVTRRGLLIGAAAGGGLLAAWGLMPRRYPPPVPAGAGETSYNAWLRIGPDGTVTVAVPQLEMGQGAATLLAQVVALELGADWAQLVAEPAPVSGAYANIPLAARWSALWMPFGAELGAGRGEAARSSRLARSFAERSRFTATADGTTLAAYEQPAREAACAVRTMLMQAAAARWDVAWEACRVAGGVVSHGTRRARFGELAEDAAGYDPADPLPLGPPPAETADRAENVPFPRLDLPAKAEGRARFAADVRLPGMVFAAIRHAPLGAEASLGRYDPAAARGDGVRLVKGERWLAAVAPTWWTAERALAAVAPRFRVRQPVDTARIDAALDKAVKKARTYRVAELGDPDEAMGERPSLVARYDVAPGLHAGLETASCTARLRDGRVELWLASQAPEAARQAVAGALGVNPRDVLLYPVLAGGSFDARLEHDHAVEAALIAREVGRPVQLTWSRWQEHLAGKPRAPAAALLWARTAPDGGAVLAWHTRIATPPAAREFGARLFGGRDAPAALAATAGAADPLAVEGAVPPYRLAHVAVDHVPVSTGIPAGRLRGNAPAVAAFFTESFVDELARAAGREPLSYRIEMLGNDVRLAECLQRCAALTGWDAGAAGSGQGLACHRLGPAPEEPAGDEQAAAPEGGRIAVIATVRRDESGVRVERLTAVADLGRIVNRDIARQQIEGGLIFGMGQTIGASTGYVRGLPVLGRLADLSLPVLANVPEIVVEFIDGPGEPCDPGELAVAAVAPAIANALHSATGIRFRKLPLFAEEV